MNGLLIIVGLGIVADLAMRLALYVMAYKVDEVFSEWLCFIDSPTAHTLSGTQQPQLKRSWGSGFHCLQFSGIEQKS